MAELYLGTLRRSQGSASVLGAGCASKQPGFFATTPTRRNTLFPANVSIRSFTTTIKSGQSYHKLRLRLCTTGATFAPIHTVHGGNHLLNRRVAPKKKCSMGGSRTFKGCHSDLHRNSGKIFWNAKCFMFPR